ncbi:CYFA0S07e01838g1_1 [Cyberlindnera fabianii]|uniref:CYFA0S07e01838g1_1 n=1 Tax=Cyberlindnera fabianii TaxID=36022 RepID=A0A061B335_CYBFA|nr:CYFA0S07e01838g1_1 [Cyberlindnera fabianii]
MTTSQSYQRIVVRGNAYERGLSHGQQLKQKIQQLAKHYRDEADVPAWPFCQHVIRNYYMPAMESYDSVGYNELQGISEGSDVAIEEIYLINARYDLQKWKNNKTDLYKMKDESECTVATVIDETGVRIGQNWDLDSYVYDHDLCVVIEAHTSPEEALPKVMITLGEVGQLGRSGMNSRGLGLCASSLNANIDSFNFPKPGPTLEHPAVIPISLARRKFLSCRNYANGLKYLVGAPRHVSGNVLVATREKEAIDLELIPESYYAIYPTFVDSDGRETLPNSDGRAFIAHSNHFIAPGYSPSGGHIYCRNPGGSSLYRHRRVATRIVDYIKKNPSGRGIQVEAIKDVFCDTVCSPNAVSEVKNTRAEPVVEGDELSMTVASVVYDLTNGTMSICKGPPHLGMWETYTIEMEK